MSKKIDVKKVKDTEKVKAQIVLSILEKKASTLIKQLNRIGKIDSNEGFDLAAALVKSLKELGKAAEQEKKHLLEPLKEMESRISEHFKPFENRIQEMELSVKQEMSLFLEENKKKILKVDQDFESGKIKKVGIYTNRMSELQVSSASAKIRKIKKLEVYAINEVPREFMVPDESKIMEALKAGKSVPGARIITIAQIAI